MTNNIKNPLNIDNILTYEETLECKNFYILANNSNEIINSAIYYYMIDEKLYDEISKNIILIKAPIELLKNKIHLSKAKIVKNYVIDKFNKYNYILNENKNIILLILNISVYNIHTYLAQFEKKNTIINFNKKILLNIYFSNKINYLKDILELTESNYWIENYYNINLTKKFIESQTKQSILHFKNNIADNNYMDKINRSNLKNNVNLEIINYKINNNNIISKSDILKILILLPEKEQFMLICNLLISKNYAYLILNNYDLLIKYKYIFKKYAQLFRYLIGYAWSIFYFEELTKKSFINKNDTFIFDINTASELPIYPFIFKYPKLNPYMTLYVNDNTLKTDENIGGVCNFTSKGITNLETFLKNFNIFCTGQLDNNLFENVEFKNDKIAIGGSVICACIQKYHPLLELFKNEITEEEKLRRYFNEYYVNSDIDIMIQTNDNFDFMKKVYNLYNQIIINICKFNIYAEPSLIKLISIKKIYLYINYLDIIKVITNNTDLIKLYITDNTLINDQEQQIKYIKNNLNNEKIISLFNDVLNNEINNYNNKYSTEIKNNYPEFFDFKSDTTNIIIKYNDDKTKKYESKILISYKYKISSPFLDHPLEIFRISYDDFFSTVHKFHLACVRAYYNGENLYLTPSCITAHLTLTNIDYNYFSGLAEPYEIINKYRMRGFGIYLNEYDKTQLLNYSKNKIYWNNLYDITNYNNINGVLNLNHKIFQPRIYNIESYYESIPINIENGYNIISKKIDYTHKDYFDEINKIYILQYNDLNNIYQKLFTISYDGSILPIKKWIIEASYDFLLY
jgi:hypothetical protein